MDLLTYLMEYLFWTGSNSSEHKYQLREYGVGNIIRWGLVRWAHLKVVGSAASITLDCGAHLLHIWLVEEWVRDQNHALQHQMFISQTYVGYEE